MEYLVNETPRHRWESLIGDSLAPMQQSWSYGVAADASGANVLRLEVRDGSRTVALAQALQRRFLLPVTLISRGPVWLHDPCDAQRTVALGLIRRHLTGPLLITAGDINSRGAFEKSGMKDVMTPSTMTLLTLDDRLRARMHGKWRNRLAHAERSGLTLRWSHGESDLRCLIETDFRQQRLRGYRALSPDFTLAWMRHAPKSVLLVRAFSGNAPCAAMLFLRHGRTATYHIGWTSDAGRAASAHNLILWNASTRMASQGVRQLDLGLVDTEASPGLARFKLGTGASPVQTGGTWLKW